MRVVEGEAEHESRVVEDLVPQGRNGALAVTLKTKGLNKAAHQEERAISYF